MGSHILSETGPLDVRLQPKSLDLLFELHFVFRVFKRPHGQHANRNAVLLQVRSRVKENFRSLSRTKECDETTGGALARLVELSDVVARRVGLGVPRSTPLPRAAVDQAEEAVRSYVTLLGGLDRYQRRIERMMAAANLAGARAA